MNTIHLVDASARSATYGFRATMTARPGKGDEVAGKAEYQDEVPVGGKLRGGATP